MNDEQIGQELKNIQLDILKEIHRVCEENNITYYLAYGSLLGAIRHDGFIPWDDDIDIMMPYEDLLKFREVCKTKLNTEKFFYQSTETEKDYKLPIDKIRRNGTILMENRLKDMNIHQGVCVDIFILYGSAPVGFKRKMQAINNMFRALYLLDEPAENRGTLFKVATKILLKLKTKKGKEKAAVKYFNKILKYTNENSDSLVELSSEFKAAVTHYKKEWFGTPQLHKFEDSEFYIPQNPDEILKAYYGDYMQLPPKEEQKYHHDYIKVQLLSE